jgi:leucyl/phenylalanyl-tRNA--protein transferase
MAFPYMTAEEYFQFPNPLLTRESVVAVGGNLSPGMLVSAYRQGLFPWYNEGEPILWHCPDPRFVIFPKDLHISKSMRKVLRRKDFELRYDSDFPAVIRGCAETPRPGQGGTWITGAMIDAYTELHKLGLAHSTASYRGGELRGGCYGILLGNVFFGESMFAREPNASKAAFLSLAQKLFASGAAFIDCQVPTEHLRSLGGHEIKKHDFLNLLSETLGEQE